MHSYLGEVGEEEKKENYLTVLAWGCLGLQVGVGGYYKLTLRLDKKYNSVALVQSECKIQAKITLCLAYTYTDRMTFLSPKLKEYHNTIL